MTPSSMAFTADEVATLTGATVNQIQHLVQIRCVIPAEPAPRRGMNRRYSARNVVEIMACVELIRARVPKGILPKVGDKFRSEFWSELMEWPIEIKRDRVTGQDVPVRYSGAFIVLDRPCYPQIRLKRAIDLGRDCDLGHPIIAAIPIGYILRNVPRQIQGEINEMARKLEAVGIEQHHGTT